MRVFGRLKNRFRILRYGIRSRSFISIDNIFKTCVVLHNLLIDMTWTKRLATFEACTSPVGMMSVFETIVDLCLEANYPSCFAIDLLPIFVKK